MNEEFRSQETELEMRRIAPAKSFRHWIVWQKARQCVPGIYRRIEDFSRQEIFSLSSQLRRAAVSIPANTGEGFKKRGQADKDRFLKSGQGSPEECRYYLSLASGF